MAQYKVLQDIEAEDKLLGPLSLRQFIYAVVVIVLGFVAYRLLLVKWFLVIPFLPPMVFFGLLAAPFGGQQSSEVWLLAKIKFFVFPKRRIWDQDGAQELVTVTAPKQIEQHLTKDFSQEEVKSRLKALANTLDTRGWAIRNSSAPYAAQTSSDRLIDISKLPSDVPILDEREADDVLDPNVNPVAQQMDQMISQTEHDHRAELLEKVRKMAQAKTQTPAQSLPAQTNTTTAQPRQPQASVQSTSATAPTANTPEPDTEPHLLSPSKLTMPVEQPQINTNPQPAKPAAPKAQAAMTDSGKPATLKEVKQGSEQPGDVSLRGDDESSNEVVVSLH